MRKQIILIFLGTVMATASAAQVDVQTPAPVLHLADNLQEADDLGWCIDTVGRGFAEDLHMHSCKPQGGDVQFTYLPLTQRIASVAFDGKCMELIGADVSIAFGLRDCSETAAQTFVFTPETGRISPINMPDQCLAAGEQIREAGPFQSRDLIIAPCSDVTEGRLRWIHKT